MNYYMADKTQYIFYVLIWRAIHALLTGGGVGCEVGENSAWNDFEGCHAIHVHVYTFIKNLKATRHTSNGDNL